MSQLVPLGKATLTVPLLVKDSGKQLVNADQLPIVFSVQKNGADADESSVSIAQSQDDTPANITGMYSVSIDLSAGGLNAVVNDSFAVSIQATVAGTIMTNVFTFTVADLAGNSPSIELG